MPARRLRKQLPKNTSSEKERTCETSKTQWTLQLTTGYQEQAKNQGQNQPDDLAQTPAVLLEWAQRIRKYK